MRNKQTLVKVKQLLKYFEDGTIPSLKTHVVSPNFEKSSRYNYLYFTLPVTLNFQRNSPAMWASALKTYEDPETRYLFYPEKTAAVAREKIQADLTKHKLALQKNKHTDIWMRISETLHKHYDSDPRNILKEGDLDVIKIIENIRINKKKDFPYLSGVKLSNYWLYILHLFTDVKFKNLNYISIIPDTHVLQSSIKLGLSDIKTKSDEVEVIWRELLDNTGINPIDVHPVLWHWSRNGFQPEVD